MYTLLIASGNQRPGCAFHHSIKLRACFSLFILDCAQDMLLPLNEERLEKLTEDYVVSNEKLKKALGIERMHISAKEGMVKTLKDFDG